MTKPVCQGFLKKYLDSAARGNGEAAILKIWSTELGVGIFILISSFSSLPIARWYSEWREL